MSRRDRRNEPRLSRDPTDSSYSLSNTPPPKRTRNTSSVETDEKGGAEEVNKKS